MPAYKTTEQYEAEAKWVGNCLVHSSMNAPRKVYMLRYGMLTTFQYVCHTCDTTGCLLDNHHFLGSPQDNIVDSVLKGRHSCFRKGGARFKGPHTTQARISIGSSTLARWQQKSYHDKVCKAMKIAQKRIHEKNY